MTEGPVGWGPLGGGLWACRDQWEGVDLLGWSQAEPKTEKESDKS